MAGKTVLEGENLEVALKILHDVCIEMQVADIPYWLEGGTLLGIIRENRILPWDNDLDISMNKTDQKKLFRVYIKLKLKGYRISFKRYKRDIGPFKKGEFRMLKIRNYKPFLRRGDVVMDIFVKRKVGDDYFWTVGVKKPVLKSSPAKFTDTLDWIDFRNTKYMIPKDYNGYLSYRYGDWKTPVKTWDFKKDDNAIVSKEE